MTRPTTPTGSALAMDAAFRDWWDGLTLQGDPDRLPNPVRTGFRGGWEAAQRTPPAGDPAARIRELEAEVERLRTALGEAQDDAAFWLERVTEMRAALRPFALAEELMVSGPQIVRGFSDSEPDDDGEFCSIGSDSGWAALRREHFREARAALKGETE